MGHGIADEVHPLHRAVLIDLRLHDLPDHARARCPFRRCLAGRPRQDVSPSYFSDPPDFRNNAEHLSLLSRGSGVRAAASRVGAARCRPIGRCRSEAVVRWRWLVALLLLIVSRSEPSRFTYLEHVFANETVDVI